MNWMLFYRESDGQYYFYDGLWPMPVGQQDWTAIIPNEKDDTSEKKEARWKRHEDLIKSTNDTPRVRVFVLVDEGVKHRFVVQARGKFKTD